MTTFLMIIIGAAVLILAMIELVIIADKKKWTWLVSECTPEIWELEQSPIGRVKKEEKGGKNRNGKNGKNGKEGNRGYQNNPSGYFLS